MDASLEESDPLYALLLNTLADVCMARGEMDKAEAYIREALKILQSKYGFDNRVVAVFTCEHLVSVLIKRAMCEKDEKKSISFLDEAEDVAQAGLTVLVKALGNKPHADVCLALLASGDVLLAMDNYSAAENVYIEAFEMAKSLFGPDVSNPLVARAFESLLVFFFVNLLYLRVRGEGADNFLWLFHFLGTNKNINRQDLWNKGEEEEMTDDGGGGIEASEVIQGRQGMVSTYSRGDASSSPVKRSLADGEEGTKSSKSSPRSGNSPAFFDNGFVQKKEQTATGVDAASVLPRLGHKACCCVLM